MPSKRFHADNSLRTWRRPAAASLIGLCLLLAHTSGTQNAIANGDTRTLDILHMHTKETASITFKRDGRYDPAALAKLNWILRDWRRDEQTRMDPRLFDIVWEVQREVGSDQPVHIVSAYRSPATNSMLRNRSRGVARESQHMVGRAMDFFLPDVPMSKVREIGMRLQRGGVGYYPTAHTPFVHLDVASVRSWPRMTRDQLVRLFPNQKTVHLPTSGPPLAGYELARADIMARGGSVAGQAVYADSGESSSFGGRRKSLWAAIFGGGEDEEEVARPQPRDDRRDQRQQRGRPQAVAATSDDAGQRGFFSRDARAPGRETQIAAAPPESAPTAAQRPNEAAARFASASSLPVNPPMPAPRPVVAALAPNFALTANAPPAEEELQPQAQRLALLPLPPSRPSTLRAEPPPETLAQAEAPSQVEAPFPPARPLAFAAVVTPGTPASQSDASPHPAPSITSLIERGPADSRLAAAAAAVPPPQRPAALLKPAAATPGPSVTAMPPSAPASRTASLAPAAQAAPSAEPVAQPAGDRTGLKALFVAKTSVARMPPRPKIATAKASGNFEDPGDLTIAQPAPVATSFRRQAATALSSGFSGSAVQGLSGTGFGFSQ